LTTEGYRVSGADETSNEQVDLVMVDVFMPLGTGVERLSHVRSAHPGAPIIAYLRPVEPQRLLRRREHCIARS